MEAARAKGLRFDLSDLLGLFGGITCIAAGIYLLTSRTQGADSYLQVMAHGAGLYFVGKGLYVLQTSSRQATHLWELRDLRATTLEEYSIPQSGSVEKECKHCQKPVLPTASVCHRCGRDITPWTRFEDAWWYKLEGSWYRVANGQWTKVEGDTLTPDSSPRPVAP